MITPTWYPDERQLRQFAAISLFGFGLLGSVALFRFGWEIAAYALWLLGGLTFLAGRVAPKLVLFVYLALMAITFPVGWLFSSLLLGIFFFGIMTPLGLLLRLFGRDPLSLKRPAGPSYWLKRGKPRPKASYYRQA